MGQSVLFQARRCLSLSLSLRRHATLGIYSSSTSSSLNCLSTMSSLTLNPNPKLLCSSSPPRNPNPNWLDLPEDVWLEILSKQKIKTIDILHFQMVCRLFRKLFKSLVFETIDLTFQPKFDRYNVDLMTRYAVDCSAGRLVDILLEYVCYDHTLIYVTHRSKNLKRLRLGQYVRVSAEALAEAVQKAPMLEEVELINWSFSLNTIEAIGRNCPSLRSFSLTSECGVSIEDEEVVAVAKRMPQLRSLRLMGRLITHEDLKALVDGCEDEDSDSYLDYSDLDLDYSDSDIDSESDIYWSDSDYYRSDEPTMTLKNKDEDEEGFFGWHDLDS